MRSSGGYQSCSLKFDAKAGINAYLIVVRIQLLTGMGNAKVGVKSRHGAGEKALC